MVNHQVNAFIVFLFAKPTKISYMLQFVKFLLNYMVSKHGLNTVKLCYKDQPGD